MNVKLTWRVFLNTRKKPTAERITKKIFAVLEEASCTLRECEIYWKNPNLHELTFKQLIQADNFDKLVVEILNKLALLSCDWNLNLSSEINEEYLENLSGDSNRRLSIVGVASMSFLIETGDVRLNYPYTRSAIAE